MTRRPIYFATFRDRPGLTDDDALAARELQARGWSVLPVAWDDPGATWNAASAVVVRSTWDYFKRIEEFRGWLTQLEQAKVKVFNPLSVLRSNLDKRYLATLAQAGVPVVPTCWIEFTEAAALATAITQAAGDFSTDELVVKPAISAGSHRTYRLQASRLGPQGPEASVAWGYRRGEALMIQPFLPSVMSEGEWSLLHFGGEFSHAILKRAKAGDFRVQSEFGGSIEAVKAPPAAREFALRAIAALGLPESPLYARADFVRHGGALLLGELELTEPSLYLAHDPAAPSRFADALLAAITS